MADDKTEDKSTDTGDKGTGTDLAAEVEKWKALSRQNEDRAKANAEAAKELESLKESGKSEAQKALDRATKAEAEVAQIPSKVSAGLRDSLVSLGVVSEDDKVLLTASDPETLIAQVRRLTDRKSDKKATDGNRAPLVGRTSGKTAEDPLLAVTRSVFGKSDD